MNDNVPAALRHLKRQYPFGIPLEVERPIQEVPKENNIPKILFLVSEHDTLSVEEKKLLFSAIEKGLKVAIKDAWVGTPKEAQSFPQEPYWSLPVVALGIKGEDLPWGYSILLAPSLKESLEEARSKREFWDVLKKIMRDYQL